ncbi:MAG: zinc-ribbon domain-containing protein [Bacilli bacterium]|nr:zinc-ribbon domain-containing protein [Bacilli bacterium]
MYCKNCGHELNDGDKFCPNCQAPVDGNSPLATSNDSGSIGWGILGFFIPLAGLILFLVWKDEKPRTAKVAGKGALFGVVFEILLYVLSYCAVLASQGV